MNTYTLLKYPFYNSAETFETKTFTIHQKTTRRENSF